MTSQRIGSCVGVLAFFALGAAGCAIRATSTNRAAGSDSHVMVNGDVVRSSADDLLELVAQRVIGTRLVLTPADPRDEPLVLVDGNALDGVHRLADIPLYDVVNVWLLRGPEATLRFGSIARKGAIVVETRRSR